MKEPNELMSKYSQLQSLAWWISRDTKHRVVSHFSGKEGSIIIRIYDTSESQKASTIYRVENIWVKPDSIANKEIEKIITQLLLIKEEYS